MGPGKGSKEFVVEEPDPSVYNLTGADPPVWQPRPEDILQMFQQLETDQVLPLKWVCPGRQLPEKEPAEQDADAPFEEDDEFEKMEEKRAPEPSAFDFDDTASEGSTRLMPRTPVSAKKHPEKRVARMDNVLSSIRRQQKAEREARSQPRSQGASPFRGGTPRMAAFSPGSSPVSRFTAASSSPHPNGSSPWFTAPPESSSARLGHPAGSPSVSHPAASPSASWLGGHSRSPPTSRPGGQAGSPSNTHPAGSPWAARGGAGAGTQHTTSPKGGGSSAGTFTATSTAVGRFVPSGQVLGSVASSSTGTSAGVEPPVSQMVSTPAGVGSGKEVGGDASVKTEPVAMETSTSTDEPGKS